MSGSQKRNRGGMNEWGLRGILFWVVVQVNFRGGRVGEGREGDGGEAFKLCLRS